MVYWDVLQEINLKGTNWKQYLYYRKWGNTNDVDMHIILNPNK